MNVIHIVRNLDRYSGAAYQALNLSMFQFSEGLKVNILNISDLGVEGESYYNNVSVLTVNRSVSFLKLYKIIRRFSIAHFHGMFLKAIFTAKVAQCKVILKTTLLGEDDFKSIQEKKFGFFRIIILRLCVDLNNSLVSPICTINKKLFYSNKVVVIPNFVNENKFAKDVKKENIVVYVGAILKRKKILDSICFFEENLQIYGYQMIIIGPCDLTECSDDVEYVSCFKEKLSRNKSLIYLGKLGQSDVLQVLSKSKALLFLSGQEGMPNVVLEALAANCFVITSSISGVAQDIYQHGVEGFDIDVGENFNIQIMDYSVDNNLPMKLAERKFYFSENAKIYSDIYKELLSD